MVSRNVESGLKTDYECAEKQYLFDKFFYFTVVIKNGFIVRLSVVIKWKKYQSDCQTS